MGFENFGLDFGNPDFVKYAESYGAHGHRLEATDDLTGLISSCQEKGGVHLIDVPVDYSENDQILNKDLPKRSATI